MNVTMLQMDFGESILLNEGDDACLMIDCGSKSDPARCRTLFQYAEQQVIPYTHREAMISHFHEDHYNGFRAFQISIFDCVYIPHIFTAKQHPNMVDYLLMRDYLRSRINKNGKPHYTLLQLLENMPKIGKQFQLLKRGDKFQFQKNTAEVLWPCPAAVNRDVAESGVLDRIPEDLCEEVFRVSDQISVLVVRYGGSNSLVLGRNFAGDFEGIKAAAEALPADYRFPEDTDPKELLDAFHWKFPKVINDHKYCLVFQIRSASDQKQYLFTGDARTEDLQRIIRNADLAIALRKNFYAVKAPHHGTVSHYCTDLFDNPSYQIEIVFISHGKGFGHYGKIYKEYIRKCFSTVCTNYSYAECPDFPYCTSRCCGLYLNPSLPCYPI